MVRFDLKLIKWLNAELGTTWREKKKNFLFKKKQNIVSSILRVCKHLYSIRTDT